MVETKNRFCQERKFFSLGEYRTVTLSKARKKRDDIREQAMPNGRCRYHGGLSPSGEGHGSYMHGLYYTKAAIASRKRFSGLLRDMKAQLGRM